MPSVEEVFGVSVVLNQDQVLPVGTLVGVDAVNDVLEGVHGNRACAISGGLHMADVLTALISEDHHGSGRQVLGGEAAGIDDEGVIPFDGEVAGLERFMSTGCGFVWKDLMPANFGLRMPLLEFDQIGAHRLPVFGFCLGRGAAEVHGIVGAVVHDPTEFGKGCVLSASVREL